MGLIQQINHVDVTHKLSHDFPELVKTTDSLPGEHHIQIEENNYGVIHPPSWLPAAIRERESYRGTT